MRADGKPGMSDEEVTLCVFFLKKEMKTHQLMLQRNVLQFFYFVPLFTGEGLCIPLLASIQGLPSHTVLRRTFWLRSKACSSH